MDDFRAIPQMAEALQDMIAKGQARLATVTAVYPNEVDASLSDGSVARFASTHNGLNAGQKGVIISAQGGAKIFTPLGLAYKTLMAKVPAIDYKSTTALGGYAEAYQLWSGSLQSLIPETATGVWLVSMTFHFSAYRSVAGGGVGAYVGVNNTSRASANTRNGTTMANNAPSTVINVQLLSGSDVIDTRFNGWSSAGTTYCTMHGGLITAVQQS